MNKILKDMIFLITDIIAFVIAWFFSVSILRYDFEYCFWNEIWYLVIGVAIVVLVNSLMGLYTKLWQYASLMDAIKILIAGVLVSIYLGLVAFLTTELTKEWAILACFIYLAILAVSRFFYRISLSFSSDAESRKNHSNATKVMIIGAGDSGATLIKEIKTSKRLNMNPVCILDDNKNKIGNEVYGVRVVGKVSEAEKFAEKYGIEQIIIAMPSVNRKTMNRIVTECQKTNCSIKTVPGIYQLATGQVSVSSIKDVGIIDLLGREQVKVNMEEIMGYIENKVVMVTGGGGSIGSELCRQIATHHPKQLIILDIYENNAYDIQQELKRHYTDLNLVTLIASVRSKEKIDDVFNKYQPQIVFHAAAHKHVPLMEVSPNEAIKNNVGGTYNVADASGRFGVEKFVLISTDKAVNPTNIMGASKRICEMIIQSMNKKYKDTDYVAVRFGNVLGSNGSVIPLFKKQIEEGGPVTVTHKDIIRYFMTIPEAVSLVLQAGAYAKGGEIFVLDMGEPVKIYDLAEKLIKLSGLEPFEDIDIKITGLRPGEKLYEERLMAEEGLLKTDNNLISIGKPIKFDEKKFFEKITNLINKSYEETEEIKNLVHEIVPTYKPFEGSLGGGVTLNSKRLN